MRAWLCLVIAAIGAVIYACVWDSDTLASEAKGMPDLVNIFAGRVDVNPPLYYEMRLSRAATAIAQGDDDPRLYDDAAMACDRLGRGEEAMKWLEKQEAILPAREADSDAVYRHLSNRGTVKVHNWFRAGKPEDVSLLQDGLKDLKAAIEINSDAHFGREAVQVAIIELFITDQSSTEPLKAADQWKEFVQSYGAERTREGLVGIIALASGPDNYDLLGLLVSTLDEEANAMKLLGDLRMHELLLNGSVRSLSYETTTELTMRLANIKDEEAIERQFSALRQQADEINSARLAYMMPKLEAGEHPDTHPDFWSGYEEKQVEIPESPRPQNDGSGLIFAVVGLFLGGIIAVIVITGLRGSR